jgi:hypothetical protein
MQRVQKHGCHAYVQHVSHFIFITFVTQNQLWPAENCETRCGIGLWRDRSYVSFEHISCLNKILVSVAPVLKPKADICEFGNKPANSVKYVGDT